MPPPLQPRSNGRNRPARFTSLLPFPLPRRLQQPLALTTTPTTRRGRRAVVLVACLSLFLYLTLVEPYYAQQSRRRQRQQPDAVGALPACLRPSLSRSPIHTYIHTRHSKPILPGDDDAQGAGGGGASSSMIVYAALGAAAAYHREAAGEHWLGAGEDCLAADVLLPATPALPDYRHEQEEEEEGGGQRRGARAIPLLATNLDLDTEGYLTRLVDRGWYAGPSGGAVARHKLVVAGGCDPLVL